MKIVAIIAFTLLAQIIKAQGPVENPKCIPVNLRCEYMEQPLGIDVASPRFSWMLKDARKGAIQTAYKITVATDSMLLVRGNPDTWETTKVHSQKTNSITYEGTQLKSRVKYYWQVIIWDKDGAPSFSEIVSFETGLYSLTDWKGSFINDGKDINYLPAPYFRKSFTLTSKVKGARAYICVLGYYELSINGSKVGDHFLDPGFTRFDKTSLYVTYDVTKYLKSDENTIGVILGNGWYNDQSESVWGFHNAPWRARPRFILNVYVDYEDGTNALIVTDNSWSTMDSPVISNNIYSGEVYDARRSRVLWNVNGDSTKGWKNANLTAPPAGRLKSQMIPPIKKLEIIKPIEVKKINDSTIVYDLRQNFAGISHIKLEGSAGTKISLRHGERINDLGSLDNKNIDKYFKSRNPNQQNQRDIFILSGIGKEEFSIRFSYHGFRYVEVTFDKPVTIHDFYGQIVHTDLKKSGSFECSNPTLNSIWKATNNSYLSNMHSIPTDCPHREKNGWTGDAHIACEFGLYNYDAISVYEKWVKDLVDEQRLSGELPGIVPTSGWGYAWGNGPTYDGALILVPWYVYLYYGDDRLIRAYYENHKRCIDYLTFRSKNKLLNIGLSDWSHWKTTTPLEFLASSYYYEYARLLSVFASIIKNNDDKEKYEKLAKEIKIAINEKYFDRNKFTYANGSQTALSTALYFGIVPAEFKDSVRNVLVKTVKEKDFHLDVGLFGSKSLLNSLTDKNADVAYRIIAQETEPSWGWWIKNGATTLHESWSSDTDASLNHIMFGEVGAWMVKGLAGINPDDTNVGFKNIIIKPHFVSGLTYAKASLESIHGLIKSEWERKNNKISLHLVIPPNTSATLYLPNMPGKRIFESRKRIGNATHDGIAFIAEKDNCQVYKVDAGEYWFELKN